MASLHRNSLTDERMTARPSPDLHSHFQQITSDEEENNVPKQNKTNKHSSPTLNTEFCRIPSAVAPKLHRSFGGDRALAVDMF